METPASAMRGTVTPPMIDTRMTSAQVSMLLKTHTQFDILLIWTTDFMESLKAAFEFHCKFRRLCRLNKQDMC